MGADSSITLAISGSELNDAVNAWIGPRLGLLIHMISQGRSPLTRNIAIRTPQIRNHLLAFADIVPRTWALMIALSTLMMSSKTLKPKMMSIMESQSIMKKTIPTHI